MLVTSVYHLTGSHHGDRLTVEHHSARRVPVEGQIDPQFLPQDTIVVDYQQFSLHLNPGQYTSVQTEIGLLITAELLAVPELHVVSIGFLLPEIAAKLDGDSTDVATTAIVSELKDAVTPAALQGQIRALTAIALHGMFTRTPLPPEVG